MNTAHTLARSPSMRFQSILLVVFLFCFGVYIVDLFFSSMNRDRTSVFPPRMRFNCGVDIIFKTSANNNANFSSSKKFFLSFFCCYIVVFILMFTICIYSNS